MKVTGRVFETHLAAAEMDEVCMQRVSRCEGGFANELEHFVNCWAVDTQTVTESSSRTRGSISRPLTCLPVLLSGVLFAERPACAIYRAKELDLCLPLLEEVLPQQRPPHRASSRGRFADEHPQSRCPGLELQTGTG